MSHEIHSVTDFQIVAPYTLRITFNDGCVRVIDFSQMLRGELYSPLRNLDSFNQVHLDVDSGTLIWPNDADFDPAILHDWDQVGDAMIEMALGWSDPWSQVTMKREKTQS